MSDAFDPYLHWLGIRDPQRPPNHYRLLGLELFEGDAEVIGNAADRQMAHVRTYQGGRHAAESQRVLNELAGAKLCLLNPQKKSAYDAQLRAELAGAAQAGEAAAPVAPGPGRVASQPGRKYALLWVTGSVVLAMAVVLASLLVFLLAGPHGGEGGLAVVPQPARATDEGESARPAAQGSGQSPGSPEGMQGPTKPPADLTAEKSGRAEPGALPGGAVSPPPSVKPAVKSEPPPKPPLKVPPAIPSKDAASKEPPSKAPAEPPTEPVPPLPQSLEAARAAMARRDLGAARQHMELAEKAAQRSAFPKDQQQLERLRDVFAPWSALMGAVEAGMRDAKPGHVFQAGRQRAEVVTATADALILKFDGAERRCTLADLPAPLALAIAQERLPAGPVLDFARVAFLLVDPGGDLDEAMRLWNEAADRGISPTAGLVAEMKRAVAARAPAPPPKAPAPAVAPAVRLPVPDEAAQQAARNEVREFYKVRFAQARTPVEKGLLAGELSRKAAETKDNPAARYALWAEARDLAVAAGDTKTLREVIQEMARGYQLDGMQEQARALAEAIEMPLPSAVRNALARAAVDAAEEALRGDAFEPAAQLAKAGFGLANKVITTKGRDMHTIRQANELVELIPWLTEQHAQAQQAETALGKDASDPKAVLFLGKYYALVKNNWGRGLPLLLKADDATLKALAESEQAITRRGSPAEMVQLAEQWQQAIGSMEEPLRRFARRRALYWYETALPRLSGYTRERATQAVGELREAETSRRKP